MTTNIQPINTNTNPFEVFNHPAFGFVRVVVKNGEPWFVGKDVAEVLGYSDPPKAISRHVDEDDKELFRLDKTSTLNKNNFGAIIINESGLYSLMLRSKLPQAKDFKRWVTSEVLPSIRKHGGYLTREKVEEILADPDSLIKLALQLKQERQARERLHFVLTFPLSSPITALKAPTFDL